MSESLNRATPKQRPTPAHRVSPLNLPKTVESARAEAHAIERCFETDSPWSALRAHTTPKDLADVKSMCSAVNPARWPEIYVEFFTRVVETLSAQPEAVRKRNLNLASDWFHEPFYYLYVQYFGSEPGRESATFDDLIAQLPYLEQSGFRNLYLLPHYESPMGDEGYDPSAFEPRASLGGAAAYERFMQKTIEGGFRVVTDAPFNHTSVEHRWFQDGLAGDDKKFDYYLRVDGRKKVGETDENGDLVSHYVDPDGTRTSLVQIFPDVDSTHEFVVERKGKQHQIFREFYPFQVDLDLRNPDVLKEIFDLLGSEVNLGVLGKRTDAIAHWIKQPGTKNDGLPATHALHALLKSFLRHVCPPAIIIPEAVRSAQIAADYAGLETKINGRKTASEGDALFAFEMQGALREMLYFQTSAAFWNRVFQLPELPGDAVWANLLEHHDEAYIGFISEANRPWLAQYIEQHGGTVYKNGMSAGGRYANCLDNDPRRIAMALFSLYMTPGTPVVFYGTEIGAQNQHEHAQKKQIKQHAILKSLGIEVPFEKAYDPRALQQGPIGKIEFQHAAESGYLPWRTVQRLNTLRHERPALRSDKLAPIANGHDAVLSLVKLPKHNDDRPLLAVANLSAERKVARFPIAEFETLLEAHPQEVLRELIGDRLFSLRVAGDAVELDLPPFAFFLFDRATVPPGR